MAQIKHTDVRKPLNWGFSNRGRLHLSGRAQRGVKERSRDRRRSTYSWAPAGVFSRERGQIRGLWNGSPHRPRWEKHGGKPHPKKCWQHVLTILYKYVVYWDVYWNFRLHLLVTNAQKHFTTFPGGGKQVPPCAHARGRPSHYPTYLMQSLI